MCLLLICLFVVIFISEIFTPHPWLRLAPRILQLFMNGIALLISFSPNSLLMYRKTRSYYLTECISFKSFLMGSSGFVMYRTISSAFRINLVFSTPGFFSYLFIVCVHAYVCHYTRAMWGTMNNFQTSFSLLLCWSWRSNLSHQVSVSQPSCVFHLFLLRSFYEFYARP